MRCPAGPQFERRRIGSTVNRSGARYRGHENVGVFAGPRLSQLIFWTYCAEIAQRNLPDEIADKTTLYRAKNLSMTSNWRYTEIINT